MTLQKNPVAEPIGYVDITEELRRCIHFVNVLVALYEPFKPATIEPRSRADTEWCWWVEEVISCHAHAYLNGLFYRRSDCRWIDVNDGTLSVSDVIAIPNSSDSRVTAATAFAPGKGVGVRQVLYQELLQEGQDYLFLVQLWFAGLPMLNGTSLALLRRYTGKEYDRNPVMIGHGELRYWLRKDHLNDADNDEMG